MAKLASDVGRGPQATVVPPAPGQDDGVQTSVDLTELH